jgi:hypothetical protein
MLFHIANLPYWIFIAIGVVLFLMVIVSGGEDEDIDADVSVDFDVEANSGILELSSDADFDGDTDIDADENVGFSGVQFLTWLGLGKSPLILLLAIDFSTWGLSGWTFNLIIGSLTGKIPVRLGGMGGIVMFSSLIIALWVGSLVSRPLGKIFAAFGEDVSSERFIGCVGTVSSKNVPYLVDGRVGQADVSDLAHNSVTITVSLPPWATVVPHHGQKILIIDQQQHSYIVIAKDSSDEDKWLSNTSLTHDT